MVSALNQVLPSSTIDPSLKKNKSSDRNILIREVAINTLKEVVITLAITGICCLFVATPAIPTLIIVTITLLAINLIIRSLTAVMIAKDPKKFETAIRIFQFICPCNFSLLHMMTSNAVIHESGHALAALSVYQNSKPKIEINPFEGGLTTFSSGHLTKLGEYLGNEGSKVFVAAAGTGLAVISAAALIGMSHVTKKDYPQLSKYFLCSGITTIIQHVFYALTALGQSLTSGHDFVLLWKCVGVHPVVAVVGIIALPILVKLGFCAFSMIKDSSLFQPLAKKPSGCA